MALGEAVSRLVANHNFMSTETEKTEEKQHVEVRLLIKGTGATGGVLIHDGYGGKPFHFMRNDQGGFERVYTDLALFEREESDIRNAPQHWVITTQVRLLAGPAPAVPLPAEGIVHVPQERPTVHVPVYEDALATVTVPHVKTMREQRLNRFDESVLQSMVKGYGINVPGGIFRNKAGIVAAILKHEQALGRDLKPVGSGFAASEVDPVTEKAQKEVENDPEMAALLGNEESGKQKAEIEEAETLNTQRATLNDGEKVETFTETQLGNMPYAELQALAKARGFAGNVVGKSRADLSAAVLATQLQPVA